MNFSVKRLIPAVAGLAVLTLTPQAFSQQQKPKMVEDVFKNVQALKGISVDDFLGTMGVMSAAIGFDCSECHNNAGTDKVDWAADDNAKKVVARRMVRMVQAINKDHFNNRQNVTCWTCHRGRDRPALTPNMETVYGQGPQDPDDVLQNIPGQPPPAQILDKYIAALGGADKLNSLKSWIGTGSSVGFGGFGGGGDVTIYAKAPNERTTWIQFKKETERPPSIRITNGKTAWIKTPLAVLTEYQLTGNELSGAFVDAMMSFPGQIKTTFTNLKTAAPQGISDIGGPSSQTDSAAAMGIGQDHPVNVVQGTGPGNTLTTMYFDQQTNLLLRIIRYTATPIGRVPTQMDLADYRDIGNGVKLPHRLTFAWLDGRDAIQLNKIQVNPAIPESQFDTPETLKQ
jgi:photosynthetic reaction center cytochrome c subunit